MNNLTLSNLTENFNKIIDNLLTTATGEHVWLRGIKSMLSSKMNLALIMEDINLFKKYVPAGNVLDFGAGSGYNSLLLCEENYTVSATDVDNAVIYADTPYHRQMAKDQLSLWGALEGTYANLKFCQYQDVTPYKDQSFDAVLAYAVIEHIPGPLLVPTLRELYRILKPNGVLYISRLPRKLSLSEYLSRLFGWGHHEKLYWDKEAVELLTGNGFEILESGYEEAVPAYPEAITNKLMPLLQPLNQLLLHTPLKYFSHHLRFVCRKR